MTKFIFITGGVVSGLGKGITAASLAYLLKSHGYTVAMQKFVNAMYENGIAVSIDDFGTGYSTLNVLKDFSISTIKLDKSLLNNIGIPNSKDEVIIRNVVKMANELKKEVIAEGVETEKQAEYLKSIQCNNVQGFLFDKPLPKEEMTKRLKEPFYKI